MVIYMKKIFSTDNTRLLSFCGYESNWSKIEEDENGNPTNVQIPDSELENGKIPCNVNNHYNEQDNRCQKCPEGKFAAQYHPIKYLNGFDDICSQHNNNESECNAEEACQFYKHPSIGGGPGHCDYKLYSFHSTDQHVLPDWLKVDNDGNPIMTECVDCHIIGKTHRTDGDSDLYHQGVCSDCEIGVLEDVIRNEDQSYECVSDIFCNDEETQDNHIGYNIIDDPTQFSELVVVNGRNSGKCAFETYGQILYTSDGMMAILKLM